jgi:hypothetical protein
MDWSEGGAMSVKTEGLSIDLHERVQSWDWTRAPLQGDCRMASSGQRERREVMQCRFTKMSEGQFG